MCWLLACGGAQPSAKELAVGSATSSAQLPPPAGLTGEEAEANAPAKLSSLETLVPADARLVVGLPSFEALWGDQAEAMRSGPLAGLARDWLQRELGLDAALIDLALKNYAGAVVLVRGEQGYGLVLRLREDISDKLAEAFKLKKTGPDSWNLPKGDGEGPINVDRVPGSNILMVTLHETLRSDMLARAAGKGEAFKRGGSAETVAAGEKGLWVSSNLAATLQENAFADRGSRFDGALSRGELRFDSVLNGSAVPRLGQLLEPAAHKGLMELPDGAVGGMSVSLRRKQGKTVSDLLAELGRMDDSDVVQLVGERLAAIGKLTLADVERGLGDELALGAYVAPGTKLDGDLSKGALVIAIATRDDALAKTAVDVFGAAVANNKSKSPKVSPGAVSLGDSETRLEVVAEKGRVLIVVGGTAFVPAMLASARKPKAKLGDGRGFSSGRARVATQQQLLAFADFALLQKLLPPEAAQGTVAANESTAFAELLLRPNTQGLDLGVHMSGETAIASGIGTLSSLAIYGTKRYLAASKTAEAKGSVFAIARGAQQAFEREGSDAASLNAAGAPIHRLCESAQAVPATVPKGAKYQPSSEKGRDYETGSPLAGWKCLKFSMVGPQFYQYDYRRGGGYKGPGRGGPNPGKDGFEISAEGDLDGDGKTSLFTITGAVDRKTNSVKLGKLFIADEFE
jgi:hypothetical protein